MFFSDGMDNKFLPYNEGTKDIHLGDFIAHLILNNLSLVKFESKNVLLRCSGVQLEIKNSSSDYYTYKNQEDNYQQDNFQLHYTHSLKPNLILNVAGHYTYGRGYYEEYKVDQSLSNYNISTIAIGGDTISSTDLIRRRWLDNDFIGTVYSLSYNKSKFNLTFGGSANTYLGRHFGEVIWARNASDSELGDRYYDENGQKTEFSNYLKGAYRTSKFIISGDLQYRHIDYSFIGFDDVSGEIKNVEQQVSFNFFNQIYTVHPVKRGKR
jgi:iron complex outermembrane receptor protein